MRRGGEYRLMAKFSECYGTFVDSRFWFISLSATMILNWHELNDQKSSSGPTGIIESKSVAIDHRLCCLNHEIFRYKKSTH
ncbi:hypothetical protein C8I07_01500 [Shewanella baltica]|nr:hypothetical protein C8I07_01500 [Shewanella baltica]